MIIQYPALLLTPVFSYWTFGDLKGCCKGNPESKLKVSFRLSWGNFVITALGNLGLFAVHFSMKESVDKDGNLTENMAYYIISCSFLVLSWITLIILHNLQKCQRCCYTCCCHEYQKTYLDPNNPDELVYPSKTLEQEEIEMVVQVPQSKKNPELSNLQDIRTLPRKLKNLASGSVLTSDEPKQSKLQSKLHFIDFITRPDFPITSSCFQNA